MKEKHTGRIVIYIFFGILGALVGNLISEQILGTTFWPNGLITITVGAVLGGLIAIPTIWLFRNSTIIPTPTSV